MNNKNLILNQLLNEKGGDEIAVKLLEKDHFKQQESCQNFITQYKQTFEKLQSFGLAQTSDALFPQFDS